MVWCQASWVKKWLHFRFRKFKNFFRQITLHFYLRQFNSSSLFGQSWKRLQRFVSSIHDPSLAQVNSFSSHLIIVKLPKALEVTLPLSPVVNKHLQLKKWTKNVNKHCQTCANVFSSIDGFDLGNSQSSHGSQNVIRWIFAGFWPRYGNGF